MRFYLGTHCPEWTSRAVGPWFLSARRLRRVRAPRRAVGGWALDSGGFSELDLYGAYQSAPADYAREARRWAEQVGPMDFAAIQDWMCEPFMLAKTGLSILEHQKRTVLSFANLKALAPEIPWIPILQGWEIADYLRHVEMYERVMLWPLNRAPLVGIGSVCRRQAAGLAEMLLQVLCRRGFRLHGFGFKISGLRRAGNYLFSADSMAWSAEARRIAARRRRGQTVSPICPLGKHDAMAGGCANCLAFALRWRRRIDDMAIQSAF